MFNYLRVFVISLTFFPVVAFSVPYTLEYSGYLTDRHTPGYTMGDYVSGSLTFDVENAYDIYDADYWSEYRTLNTSPDFVTGYVAPNIGLNRDYVRFSNEDSDNPEPSLDAFNINDESIVDGVMNALFISVAPPALDWTADDKVTEFTFTADQLDDQSLIIFQTANYRVDQWGPELNNLSQVYYQLDFARLSRAVVNVPEPDSLFLSFVGLLALLLGRRSRAN